MGKEYGNDRTKPTKILSCRDELTRVRFFEIQLRARAIFKSQFSLGARQLAGNARVVLARGVHGAREGLEQRLDDVVRLVAVKQFQMQIAPRLVGKALEKFPRQPKAERAGQVLIFFGGGNFLL
jgi:hypothetical protein